MLRTVLPNKELSFLIRRFLLIEPEDGQNSLTDKFIPDGCVSLAFNFGGKVSIFDDNKRILLPGYFIVVPVSRTIFVEVNHIPETLVAVCNASVFSRFFGIKFTNFYGGLFPKAENVIPRQVYNAMGCMQNHSERIPMLEHFLLKLTSQKYFPDEIDRVYDQIMNCYGVENVNRLLENLNFNPRSFRRKFQCRVGISAKALSRIVRVNYLWNCYLTNNKADFQEMVYSGGYHDQAHLINDFKKIIGETPAKFFKRDQHSLRIISGK
ncbi:MAG: helix-turn-helix domain-containing protein [Prolixibacteraceae bacterium]|nr:helix-turn-helix domain-containing protein [Prolixibacteraceae bacterium]